jgi:hypothetical protein
VKLTNFVTLYRQSSHSSFEEGKLVQLSCDCNEDVIARIRAIDVDRIEVDAICIDGSEFDIDDLQPSESTLELELQIPTNGEFDVYRSLDEMLLDARTLLNGDYPPEFYIVDDDFYSIEQVLLPTKYQNLFNICSLIKGLGELAHYHDAKGHDGRGNNFVFIDESEIITAKPVVLKPVITIDMLNQPVLDVTLIESFHSPKEKVSPTVGKEKAFFRVSIIEFVGQLKHLSQTELFVHLVMNWTAFLDSYQRNLEIYLSGFAFHKARKDVSDAEFKVAEQYSKLLGDIAGKLFGLPVSFVALLGLFNTDVTYAIEFVVVFSLLAASWLMSNLVTNQTQQLERIYHSKGIAFDALDSQKTAYPKDLQTKLTEAITALDDEYQRLKQLFGILWYVVWSPTVLALLIILFRYVETWIAWLCLNVT